MTLNQILTKASIETILQKLRRYYDVGTDAELAQHMQITEETISYWKQNNIMKPIRKKCKELEIYDDIFSGTGFEELSELEKAVLVIGKEGRDNAYHISKLEVKFNSKLDGVYEYFHKEIKKLKEEKKEDEKVLIVKQ